MSTVVGVSWRTAWKACSALRRWRRLARLGAALRPLERLAWALAVCGCLTAWAPWAGGPFCPSLWVLWGGLALGRRGVDGAAVRAHGAFLRADLEHFKARLYPGGDDPCV
jgi:hypothetical protein